MRTETPSYKVDVGIVGAGPAGITVALEIARNSNKSIWIIESGGMEFAEHAQELAAGENAGLAYESLDSSRYRQFGGTYNGGAFKREGWPTSLIGMDPLDFESRSWVPHSGWPIERAELDRHYECAHSLAGTRSGEPNWGSVERPFLPLDPMRLETCVWQVTPGLNFGRKYHDELRRAQNVRLLLNSTVVEILTDSSGGRAAGVRISGADGRLFDVNARIVVLACGGIENARLLLLSTSSASAGLGNGNDLVGRFFMQHPHVTSASIRLQGTRRWLGSYRSHEVAGTFIWPGMRLAPDAQKRHEVLNHSAVIVHEIISNNQADAQAPGYIALKELVSKLKERRLPTPGSSALLGIVLKDSPAVARALFNRVFRMTPAIYTRSEQAPNPQSRVTLSDSRDRLGLRKARLDWRLTPLDKRTIRIAVAQLQREFSRLGLGTVIPKPWVVEDEHSWPDSLGGGHHHMGTTRMGHSPGEAVVDCNGQVFGVTNLYVTGSSVFPTGGFANPTLTVIALARRLAEHLVAKLKEPEAESTAPLQ